MYMHIEMVDLCIHIYIYRKREREREREREEEKGVYVGLMAEGVEVCVFGILYGQVEASYRAIRETTNSRYL